MTELAWLARNAPIDSFPAPHMALHEPDGLLAAGGDLSTDRLLHAYQHGIFPWFEEGQPVLWWTPNPRCVLRCADFHRSRSLLRTLRRQPWRVSFDQAFAEVIDGCAEARSGRRRTWITASMRAAYQALQQRGFGRSVEVWDGDELIGGIYGVAIGRMYFGESMFSRRADASKVALLALCQQMAAHDMPLLDCQVRSAHLTSLGATMLAREEFLQMIAGLCPACVPAASFDPGAIPVLNFKNSAAFQR
ncbi:MAG: leucyl/phenylalanyl-tRNA--protein transferase [Pseudomonadota bacterium]